jgi:hypothetical protein
MCGRDCVHACVLIYEYLRACLRVVFVPVLAILASYRHQRPGVSQCDQIIVTRVTIHQRGVTVLSADCPRGLSPDNRSISAMPTRQITIKENGRFKNYTQSRLSYMATVLKRLMETSANKMKPVAGV